MNILAIGAHPDDIEFGCAAVLIKEIKRGNVVKLLVLSRGEAGSKGTPEGREEESRKAAALMGASIEFLDFGGDCHMQYVPENGMRIAEEIRKFQPAIVLAPNTEENQHPDHSVVGKIVRDACRFARYGGLGPVHKISSLYFYNITQYGAKPDIVVDISDVVTEWVAAMNCHATQVSNRSYVELQTTAARFLGVSIGVEYAAGLYVSDPVRVEHLSDIVLSSRNF